MSKRTISDYSTLPDGWTLYRALLASQPDHSVSICSLDFVSCLTQLLASEPDELSSLSGVELVRKKVKSLYIMAGVFSDINWTDIHPIKQVYMNYNCNTGQKMWDPMPLIHAVEGDASFLLSERGIVTLTSKFGTTFTPSAIGHHRYQKLGSNAWCDAMLQKIRSYNAVK
ncbi:MAG: hypothetical protein E7101_04415 [Prevotella ruminicola]|uniref:Uncharacterized protein n=1 Tax=Xylanibacter ruminicola TaxID=839 RepID=A0A9D5NZ29_XYLRU|nr:hypothetical protein [Xylanibacter ruminicola]